MLSENNKFRDEIGFRKISGFNRAWYRLQKVLLNISQNMSKRTFLGIDDEKVFFFFKNKFFYLQQLFFKQTRAEILQTFCEFHYLDGGVLSQT